MQSQYISAHLLHWHDALMIGACVPQVVADIAQDPTISQLAPGAEVEVSQVVGRGFCSLLNSYEGLLTAMEVSG